MPDLWKTAKVGLLVAVAAIATYAIYRLVEERSSGDDGYIVWAVFDDAQGLVPKSRVLVAGIQVGTIHSIRLWGAKARVDIQMQEGVKIYRNATILKRTASILGEGILVIAPGTHNQPPLQDGDRIETGASSASTDEIMGNVGAIATSVRKVTDQLERAFGTDQGGQQMTEALKNLSQALEGINRTIQTNEQIVHHTLRNVEDITTRAAPEIQKILANVEMVTQDVRRITSNSAAGQKTGSEEMRETVASIHRASEQLEGVIDDIRRVTERTARGEGTIGRLTTDDQVIDEVEGVVEGVNDFVGGLTRLQTIVGLRSEYNYLANTFKSYVELRLQPREDRYYLIQLIDDPRGLTKFTQTTVRTSPPSEGDPNFYQENRVVTEDAFRFSLMFAKRIYFTTLRFGILESTGGLGADFHLFGDDLEINADLFAFGEQAFPRLRARLAYQFVQRIWLLAGLDDTLNPDTRDYFGGAQLRFNDEDLKSILPFISGP